MSSGDILLFDRPPWAPAYMLLAAWPAARRADRVPAIAARWEGHQVVPRQLAAFLRATGLPAGPSLPLLYPHTIGFRLVMAAVTRPSSPFPIWSLLQTRNHLLQHRPVAVTDRLDFETRACAMRNLEKGAELDLHTTVRVAGALVWESVITFYSRGRFGLAGTPSPHARAPAVAGPLVAAWSMRDDAHWRFGHLTGDYNGIHLWDWYARRFGFAGALYHPPRVLGECLARLPALDANEPQRLDVWLRGPVPHGAGVRLHARATPGSTTFVLHAADERPCLVGRLQRGRVDRGLVGADGTPLPVETEA